MHFISEEKEINKLPLEELRRFGCLADTGFLYALAFDDDRFFSKANELFETLAELKIPIFANVISRIEFIDLIFRKQVTNGCIQLFEELKHPSSGSTYNLLKDIRDKDTASKRQGQSYKIDERRLKRLRSEITQIELIDSWKRFCQMYLDKLFINEWQILEEDLGLNFIEVLENEVSDWISQPVQWLGMVSTMATHGIRGPDAMIVNLFSKSEFQLLVTTDSDFVTCFNDPLEKPLNKFIYLLQ